jgi:hypothetical protein
MEQRVIDPIKAKRARESVTAFKDYVKSILKITEGFVSDDTVRQYVNKGVMEYWNRVYSFAYEDKSFSLFASDMRNLKKLDPLAQSVYDAMCSDNLDVYPKLMCAFLESCNGQRENNDVRKGSHYDIAKVIKKIDDFAINFNQAYMYKEVEITKPLTNLK